MISWMAVWLTVVTGLVACLIGFLVNFCSEIDEEGSETLAIAGFWIFVGGLLVAGFGLIAAICKVAAWALS